MDLDKIRKKVDSIDAELLSLINKRMELTVRVTGFKEKIEDSGREAKILDFVKARSKGLLMEGFSEKLFMDIISESKRLQEKDFTLVGFRGEHGAYCEIVASTLADKAVPIPHSEFVEVFDGLKSGAIDMGIVPIENSLAGNVKEVDDLLIENDLNIIAEIKLPIHHCLVSLPDTDYRDIRVVYSHHQALSQCRGFIARNKLEARPYYDAAGAAMMLAQEKLTSTAVIASPLVAQLYNLEVLKEHVEDDDSSFTRYIVLSKGVVAEAGDKCSIVFSAAHKPGALFRVLSIFSEAKINLTRIESRLLPNAPGMYAFLLDFLGSDKETNVKEGLAKVQGEAEMYKFLGCYKRAE